MDYKIKIKDKKIKESIQDHNQHLVHGREKEEIHLNKGRKMKIDLYQLKVSNNNNCSRITKIDKLEVHHNKIDKIMIIIKLKCMNSQIMMNKDQEVLHKINNNSTTLKIQIIKKYRI
jgi:hypothetical protein